VTQAYYPYDHSGHAHSGPAHPSPDHPGAAGPAYALPRQSGIVRLVVALNERTPAWGAPAAILLCFLGAASYVWISNPTNGGAADVPTCIVKLTTGFDCPGCGGTRAFYYLLHGNVAEAARYHVMAVFAAPFLVWLYLAWAVKRVSGRQLPVPNLSPRAISLFLAAWALFMVVRNLPFAPFTALYV
jgi:hypothetical protein